MKDTIKFSETCVFPSNIADITSISMECNYESEDNNLTGNFLIEGTYRTHELSINKENFSYNIPFNYEFKDEIDNESVTVNINDFTYDIDETELNIDIEYEVTANIKEIIEEKIEEPLDRIEIEEIEEIKQEINDQPTEMKNELEEEITNNIIENINSNNENYITYHIHQCDESDSLESISSKYKISIDTIRNYNDIETITNGTKIIIPEINE